MIHHDWNLFYGICNAINKHDRRQIHYLFSLLVLDRKDSKYFPQVFLEECKYIVKEKKIHNYIIDYVEISSDEEDLFEKNSDFQENSDNEKSSDGENYI